MSDVVIFMNKLKKVLELISDEEMDFYNDIYNNYPTETLISWINKKYKEYKDKINAD